MVFNLEGVQKKLDRLGTSTRSDFRQVKEGEAERYLDWDLNHNTLVVMHQLILRQGGEGYSHWGLSLPLGGRAMVSLERAHSHFRSGTQGNHR